MTCGIPLKPGAETTRLSTPTVPGGVSNAVCRLPFDSNAGTQWVVR
jgi:hypothetical protein